MTTKRGFTGRSALECGKLGSDIRRMYYLGQSMMAKNPELKLIDLSLGNPDLEPPKKVDEAWITLASSHEPGVHRYMDNSGYEFVREFLALQLSAEFGFSIKRDQVYLSAGAAGGLQIVLKTILDPGDEVILFRPYFSEYIPYLFSLGVKPVFVDSDENHIPSLHSLAAQLSDKTRAIILNSPNNPSGMVYPKAFYVELAGILGNHNKSCESPVQLVSDEPYGRLVFDGESHFSPISFYPYSWVIRSHSKDIGLAGERIGYFFWSEEIANSGVVTDLKNMSRALGFVNAPAFMQRLLPKIYNLSVHVLEYQERTYHFHAELIKLGYKVVRPKAGFFIFPKIPDGWTDTRFCEALLHNGVIVVPGSSFGAPGYVRCSLTQKQPILQQALKSFSEVLK